MFVGLGVRTQLLYTSSPAALFAAGEVGAWYDPSDLSTMFQDSAGTTPVTTVGQPVGLRLDKSKGLVLGPELVTNGDFSSGTTGWTAAASTIAVVSGELEVTATGVSGQQALGSFSVVAGRAYRVTGLARAAATNSVAKSARVEVDISGTRQGRQEVDANGVTKNIGFTFFATATGVATIKLDVASITAWGAVGDKAYFDNISVKELPGNHASQSTPGSRAIYASVPKGGRRNLLTYTEDLTNAVWTAINGTTKNAALNFTFTAANSRIYQSSALASGATYTLSVRFSDADVGKKIRPTFFDSVTGWSLLADTTIPVGGVVTRTFTTSNAGTFVGFQAASDLSANTSFTPVAGQSVQLETGSTATNYQRVGSVYDITEAGVQTLYGLLYDGLDDFYVTPTITPGTDKAQVFAGVRKLSDAAGFPIIVESSTDALSLDGAFAITATGGAGTATYQSYSRGTISTNATTGSVYPAPRTSVLAAMLDIGGDGNTLRVDGVQAAQATADQGTGNYLAYPLYIGRRGGGTLPYNGYEFGLIVRFGPNLSTAQIASVEGWLNTRTGAY